MSNAHRFAKECNGTHFNYGGTEETIGFFFDNYYEALKIYRTIVKQMKEIDEKREDAHQQLQKLRADEDRWKKQGGPPKDFDAEEHQSRKDHLAELREMEYEIMYEGQPLPHNKLTNMIMKNMHIFRRIEAVDRSSRKTIAPVASQAIKIGLWPLIKMMKIHANQTASLKTEDFLRKSINQVESIPDRIKKKIEIN